MRCFPGAQVVHVHDLLSEVHLVGLGLQLECPYSFRLSWNLQQYGHGDEL